MAIAYLRKYNSYKHAATCIRVPTWSTACIQIIDCLAILERRHLVKINLQLLILLIKHLSRAIYTVETLLPLKQIHCSSFIVRFLYWWHNSRKPNYNGNGHWKASWFISSSLCYHKYYGSNLYILFGQRQQDIFCGGSLVDGYNHVHVNLCMYKDLQLMAGRTPSRNIAVCEGSE